MVHTLYHLSKIETLNNQDMSLYNTEINSNFIILLIMQIISIVKKADTVLLYVF